MPGGVTPKFTVWYLNHTDPTSKNADADRTARPDTPAKWGSKFVALSFLWEERSRCLVETVKMEPSCVAEKLQETA